MEPLSPATCGIGIVALCLFAWFYCAVPIFPKSIQLRTEFIFSRDYAVGEVVLNPLDSFLLGTEPFRNGEFDAVGSVGLWLCDSLVKSDPNLPHLGQNYTAERHHPSNWVKPPCPRIRYSYVPNVLVHPG